MMGVSVSRHPTLVFTLLIRGLQVIAGLVSMYGLNGMFTSNGIEPPNVTVYGGVALALFAALAQAVVGARWYAGWWLYAGTLSVALAFITLSTIGVAECTGQLPPPGTTRCAAGGTHLEFRLAVLIIVASLAGAIGAMRTSLSSRRTARTQN